MGIRMEKILGMLRDSSSDKKETIWQLFKFCLVGASNEIVYLLFYYALIYIKIGYMGANLAAYVISIFNAYFWNNKFVFKKQENSERSTVKSLAKVFASYGITFLISTGLLFVWVEVLHISEYAAPIINLIVTIPINFLLNKLWAFKDKI